VRALLLLSSCVIPLRFARWFDVVAWELGVVLAGSGRAGGGPVRRRPAVGCVVRWGGCSVRFRLPVGLVELVAPCPFPGG
jgi:hypothetical protein